MSGEVTKEHVGLAGRAARGLGQITGQGAHRLVPGMDARQAVVAAQDQLAEHVLCQRLLLFNQVALLFQQCVLVHQVAVGRRQFLYQFGRLAARLDALRQRLAVAFCSQRQDRGEYREKNRHGDARPSFGVDTRRDRGQPGAAQQHQKLRRIDAVGGDRCHDHETGDQGRQFVDVGRRIRVDHQRQRTPAQADQDRGGGMTAQPVLLRVMLDIGREKAVIEHESQGGRGHQHREPDQRRGARLFTVDHQGAGDRAHGRGDRGGLGLLEQQAEPILLRCLRGLVFLHGRNSGAAERVFNLNGGAVFGRPSSLPSPTGR